MNVAELSAVPIAPSDEPAAGASYDVAVVGAGFGGLGAALALAEQGARVVVCEALTYPGGCASTFERDGYSFDAGATLISGLGDGQLFRRWIDRYGLEVPVAWPDPVVEMRTPRFRLCVPRSRAELAERLAGLPDAPPRRAVDRFFARQRRVADALWPLLDDPSLMPPLDLASAGRHLLRAPGYVRLLPIIGRSLLDVMQRDGVAGSSSFRVYADAVSQITVQCPAAEAEAPFALSALDYWFRGTGHVVGGVGRLAWGLVEALRGLGVDVRFGWRVRGLRREAGRWRIQGPRGAALEADRVAANLVPRSLLRITREDEVDAAHLGRLAARVEDGGWGACMLYLGVRPPADAGPEPLHLELVGDPDAPFTEGNHVFCSLSGASEPGRAPDGRRAATLSAHVPMGRLLGLPEDERGRYVAGIQRRMAEVAARLAPGWFEAPQTALPASPRTFERFVGRFAGYVGGAPRRAGLSAYAGLLAKPAGPGLVLVGDSVFPGQSALAAAVGGCRAAERLTGRSPVP